MIAHITGILERKSQNRAVVDVGGIADWMPYLRKESLMGVFGYMMGAATDRGA